MNLTNMMGILTKQGYLLTETCRHFSSKFFENRFMDKRLVEAIVLSFLSLKSPSNYHLVLCLFGSKL